MKQFMKQTFISSKRLQKPLIFIGPGRSGSTIISEFILIHELLAWPSNHTELYPKLTFLNLLRPLFDNRYWRIIGEKGQLNRTRIFNNLLPRPAEAYPFWNRITPPSVDFARDFLIGKTATAEDANRIRGIIDRLVKMQGKSRFSMKITGPGRIGYLKSIFPDAIFINVIREPAATVQSLLKVPFWHELGIDKLWWQGAYSEEEIAQFQTFIDNPVATTAFQLNKILTTTRWEAEQLDAKMLTINYEQFVSEPRDTLSEIMQFAELPPSDWIEEKLRLSPVHDRNRKTQFSPEDQLTIDTLCPKPGPS